MNFQNMNEKNRLSINKTIVTHLIMSKIQSIITSLAEKKKGKTINKSVLIGGLYNEFLLKLIYFKGFSKSEVDLFIGCYVTYYKLKPNRHFKRKSLRPFGKWYCKQFQGKQKNKKFILEKV